MQDGVAGSGCNETRNTVLCTRAVTAKVLAVYETKEYTLDPPTYIIAMTSTLIAKGTYSSDGLQPGQL